MEKRDKEMPYEVVIQERKRVDLYGIGESPGCGSILVAFGEENAETLRSSNIEGRYIQVNQEPCNTHVDWEQHRYEIAKTILPITSVSGRGPHGELILEACDKAAELAVIYADALIKELK